MREGRTISLVNPSWSEVRAAYGPALARIVASYAPPGADREDLAQEVAMALVRALPTFRGEASLRTYVMRVARNVCLREAMRHRAWSVEQVVERFTRRSDDVIEYSATVMDPSIWIRPWTMMVPWRAAEGPLFEYACHEGNYSMTNLLAASRAVDAQR